MADSQIQPPAFPILLLVSLQYAGDGRVGAYLSRRACELWTCLLIQTWQFNMRAIKYR